MDNVTHALLGVSIMGLRSHPKSESRGLWLAVMLGSQAPDFDLLPGLFNPQAQVAFHRGDSHSWVGLAIIVGLITLSIGVLETRVSRKKIAFWSFLAVLVHLTFDALTCYGTRILLPFNREPIALDFLFIVDIPIILTLGIGSFFYLYRHKTSAMRVALIIVLLYLAGRGSLHYNLLQNVERQVGAERCSVVPLLNPLGKWMVLVDRGEKYSLGEITPITGKLVFKGDYAKNLSIPLVKKLAANPVIDSFLEIARFPYAQVSKQGKIWQVKFADLRQWPYGGFNALVILDENFQVQNIKLSTWN
jgi:inner membrane protein